MDPLEAFAILVAGVAAGAINAVVGSGTLITFPVLIALGFQPLVANVSNSVGLVPGAVAGAYGYRRELEGQHSRVRALLVCSIAGAAVGAVLLLVLPPSAFEAIVPILVAIAIVLVLAQPWINKLLTTRPEPKAERGFGVRSAVTGSAIYGGYFGAAGSVLLIGILGIGIRDDLQRLNALKNVLVSSVSATASLIFIFAADVDWAVTGLIAAGSTAGGLLGSNYGRRLPSNVLRGLIVLVGMIAIVRLTLA